jgi:hypothetical protein
MKLITTGLLLFSIVVVALSAHHDVDIVSAQPATVSGDTIVSAPADAGETITIAADVSAMMLTTVCVFIIVCCVLLVAARFSWRRVGARTVLVVSPRGSPSWTMPSLGFLPRLSLSQLSISRT